MSERTEKKCEALSKSSREFKPEIPNMKEHKKILDLRNVAEI
jgi:hypothetical protein